MHAIRINTRGLMVLANVHLDRLLCLAVVGGALWAGSWLCSVSLQ